MLSGEHTAVPIDFIYVDRENRIRKELKETAIAEKMDSISRVGLIHALVIQRDGKLVAGETRLNALQRLGWTQVPIQWADTLDQKELLAIELEENIKRVDLTWQDQCDALKKFHELHVELDPDWQFVNTAEALGISQSTVSQQLGVAHALAAGDARVAAAPRLSIARGIVARQRERMRTDVLKSILLEEPEPGTPSEPVAAPAETSPILQADFNEWAPTYTGRPFNFLHCDFPYGINADKFAQAGAKSFGGYEDTPETYWSLCATLIENKEALLGDSAHILFWFSPRWYAETLALFREHFWVDPYPLIWVKTDNKGALPDPTRGPRRIYEMAFIMSHGDRRIISAVSNAIGAPTVRLGEHMSEKNPDMLKHFMRMIVDENTRMLDPTCGSGSALRAARDLGASSVLGLEVNPEYVESARRAYEA